MHFPLLTTTLVLLLTTTTLALPSLSSRQAAAAAPLTCATYAYLANHTSIALNSTLRAAFLRSSPQGTDPTRAILDRAAAEFATKNLMFDRALNARCGNLSVVAAREVERNFSGGVVAGWTVAEPVGARIGAGTEVWCIGLILVLYAGFGMSL